MIKNVIGLLIFVLATSTVAKDASTVAVNSNTESPYKNNTLVGYAFDGLGIYGPGNEDGKMVTDDQLDVCHGHVGKVLWNGKIKKMYHYHLNYKFPYSIGCFKDKS